MLTFTVFLVLNLLALSSCLNVANIEVNWTNRGDRTEFVLKSPLGNTVTTKNFWFGIGFGNQMNYVNTVICKSSPFNAVEHYYNGFFVAMPFPNPNVGISRASVEVIDNIAVCRFTRENALAGVENYYQITSLSATNLIGAYGLVKNDGNIEFHKKAGRSIDVARFPVLSVFIPPATPVATTTTRATRAPTTVTTTLLSATTTTTIRPLVTLQTIPAVSTLQPQTTNSPTFTFPDFTANFFQNLLNTAFAQLSTDKAKKLSSVTRFLQTYLKPSYIDFILDQVSAEQMKTFFSVGAAQLDSMKIRTFAVLSPAERVSYFKDLAIVQNFMTSIKSQNLHKILSALDANTVTKLMICPDFIKYASSVLRASCLSERA